MQIKTLADIIENLAEIRSRHGGNRTISDKIVYVCHPHKHSNRFLAAKPYPGKIVYSTRSSDELIGRYYVEPEATRECDKITRMLPDFRLAEVQSEENCSKYPELSKLTLYTEDSGKRIYTEPCEAKKYIADVLSGTIKIPEFNMDVTMK